MEWSKAKNVMLILLIIVNIILLVLNVYKRESNTVSTDRINNIKNVCAKNNIAINCDLPKNIDPTSQISVSEYDYDYVKLQQIFFGSITDVNRTTDLTNVIFSKNGETLVVENAKVIFTGNKKDYSSYVDGIKDLIGPFNVERKTSDMVYYFQEFNGYPIFSNYICVDLTSAEKMTITINYGAISRSVGSKQNIIGSDEAIYSAIDRICDDIEENRSINLVEKGYYDSRTALSEVGAIPPAYAIYVNNKVYFVNAYTGSCYK